MGRILIKDAPLSKNQKEHFTFCFSTDNSVESLAPSQGGRSLLGGCRAAAWRPGLLATSSPHQHGRSQLSMFPALTGMAQVNSTTLLPFSSHLYSCFFPEEQICIKKSVIWLSTNHGEKLQMHYCREPGTNKDLAVWCCFEIIVSKDPNVENTLKQL